MSGWTYVSHDTFQKGTKKCKFSCRMSRRQGWIPKPDASCGTASSASSRRDALSFSLHIGARSLLRL